MEIINEFLSGSIVLQNICDDQTQINKNINDLFDKEEITQIQKIKKDIHNLINKNLDNIQLSTIENLVNITHKYNIQTHYQTLIIHISKQIIKLEEEYIKICLQQNDNIICDIININTDYKNAIKYILNMKDDEYIFDINDFLHNKKLYTYAEDISNIKYKIINTEKLVKYGDLEMVTYVFNIKNIYFVNMGNICAYAKKYDKSDILLWAHKNGWPIQ